MKRAILGSLGRKSTVVALAVAAMVAVSAKSSVAQNQDEGLPRQVMMQIVMMDLNPRKMADNKFDVAADLGLDPPAEPEAKSRPPLVASLNQRETKLLIRSLMLSGAARVISRPAAVTIEGQPAATHVGGEIPLIEIEQTINGKREIRREFCAFGIDVEITPRLVDGKTIHLKWKAESSQLVRNEGKLPRLVIHGLQEEADCRFGETIVMADIPVVAAEGETAPGLVLFITPELVAADAPPLPSPASAAPVRE